MPSRPMVILQEGSNNSAMEEEMAKNVGSVHIQNLQSGREEKGVLLYNSAVATTMHNQVSSVNGGTMGRFINGSMGCSQIAGGLPGHAIVAALTSGNKIFFVGTDSAPHDRIKKKCACGCAGVFNAHVVLSVYAKVFKEESESQPFVKAVGNIFTGLSSLEEMYDMNLIL
ncbi:dihydroorotase, mitochondrial isoform X1 [Tanacetum coccineum]